MPKGIYKRTEYHCKIMSESHRGQLTALKHGHSRGKLSPTYNSWRGMVQRCTNSNHNRWQYYGGRGIVICERWRKFANFLSDMGEKPMGTSIERIDNDGNYEPKNCKWATAIEQRHNRPYTRKKGLHYVKSQ